MSYETLRTPHQASYIFNLDGPAGPRPKNLFFTRFRRAKDASSSSGDMWQKDLGFLIKSVGRPSVQPQVEEVNQYNKKRLVHTGYKTQPIRMSIYDTADSMALQMFSAYSKHYFGDFRHTKSSDSGSGASSVNDFAYDAMSAEFLDSEGKGFGFAPSKSQDDNEAIFFFNSIQVFQVFGDMFILYDLINPKITGFEPDELDYTNSDIGTFNLTISYEAVIYANDGLPAPISENSYLNEIFGDLRLDGDVFEVPDVEIDVGLYRRPGDIYGLPFVPEPLPPDYVVLREYDRSDAAGPLSAYGAFTFGSTVRSKVGWDADGRYQGFLNRQSQDLSLTAVNDPVLAAALNVGGVFGLADIASQVASQPYNGTAGLDPALYDVAKAAIKAAGDSNQRYDSGYIGDAVVQNIIASSRATGTTSREQVYNTYPGGESKLSETEFNKLQADLAANGVTITQNTGTTVDASTRPNTWNSASGNGVALTPQAYGLMNAQRPASSQIGFNRKARRPGGV